MDFHEESDEDDNRKVEEVFHNHELEDVEDEDEEYREVDPNF